MEPPRKKQCVEPGWEKWPFHNVHKIFRIDVCATLMSQYAGKSIMSRYEFNKFFGPIETMHDVMVMCALAPASLGYDRPIRKLARANQLGICLMRDIAIGCIDALDRGVSEWRIGANMMSVAYPKFCMIGRYCTAKAIRESSAFRPTSQDLMVYPYQICAKLSVDTLLCAQCPTDLRDRTSWFDRLKLIFTGCTLTFSGDFPSLTDNEVWGIIDTQRLRGEARYDMCYDIKRVLLRRSARKLLKTLLVQNSASAVFKIIRIAIAFTDEYDMIDDIDVRFIFKHSRVVVVMISADEELVPRMATFLEQSGDFMFTPLYLEYYDDYLINEYIKCPLLTLGTWGSDVAMALISIRGRDIFPPIDGDAFNPSELNNVEERLIPGPNSIRNMW